MAAHNPRQLQSRRHVTEKASSFLVLNVRRSRSSSQTQFCLAFSDNEIVIQIFLANLPGFFFDPVLQPNLLGDYRSRVMRRADNIK
jgi:hypothetical protein